VDLALSVGIFPYVLKLLQTTSQDLRTTLVFIWAKILALDKSCQVRMGFRSRMLSKKTTRILALKQSCQVRMGFGKHSFGPVLHSCPSLSIEKQTENQLRLPCHPLSVYLLECKPEMPRVSRVSRVSKASMG
jgi:hypothetical protein